MTDKMGCLVVDLQGTQLSQEDKELLAHPLIGGIILFARNYESRLQLKTLCQQIRRVSPLPRLMMVDQEGGHVQRFIAEFTKLPYMAEFGKLFDVSPTLACKQAKDCGRLMADELLSVSVDLSLAPVLDLNKGTSNVIGQRAFHARPEVVIDLATAFMTGMQTAGMAATGKHFPGHGSVNLDSHIALPVDERSQEEIFSNDLLPFVALIQAGLPAMMTAHIVFPKVDRLPVSFSYYWLNNVLRKQLRFKGAILSDDLNMEGANISANYSDRIRAAREAGCDFTLLCNNRKGVIQALDQLSYAYVVEEDKWKKLKGRAL